MIRIITLGAIVVLCLVCFEAWADMSRKIPSTRVALRSDARGNFLTDLSTTPEAWAHLKDSSVLEKYRVMGDRTTASYGGSFSSTPDAKTYDGAFYGPEHSDPR